MPRVCWPVAACGVAALMAGRWRRPLGLAPLTATVTAAAAPLSLSAAISSGRLRRAVTWLAQMLAYEIAFEAPIDRRAALRSRLSVDYPIRIDSAIGLGAPPSERLQRALRHPPRITRLDRVATLLYALWELEPHAAMLWFLLRRENGFPSAAGRLAATFDLTLLGYWLVPTAPPWWSSEKLGRMNGTVRRVVIEAKRELRDERRPTDEHEVGANPWAAMPSDHFASALMTGLVLLEVDRRLGTLALGYAGLLGVCLVYLGEHYVIDLMAGGTLAAAVYLAASRVEPVLGRVAKAWPAPRR
jgi:membrane-associated phospholipid phosphatase